MEWKLITDIIVALAILTLGAFVCTGIYQLIKRKSFKKVDRELLWMPLPLTLMAITYVIFEKFIILATRPNGSGEPSFPSTHTMITATIFFVAIITLPKYIKSRSVRIILEVLMVIGVILVGVGRVLANMHWPTDILGAIVFSFIFAEIYYEALKKSTPKSPKPLASSEHPKSPKPKKAKNE